MTNRFYRDRDYVFGEAILALRVKIGLTQAGLAKILGVSRRTVVGWESGNSYPKTEYLKELLAFAIKQHAFSAGKEADKIREFWQIAHQKVLLDEDWLAGLLLNANTFQVEQTTESKARRLQPTTSSVLEGPRLDWGDVSIGTVANATTPVEVPHQTRDNRSATINLPFQPTPFIGRDAELAEITRILGDPACRLLTLVGPGGIGKTRLAIEVASRHMDTFQDGAIFVGLAPVSTPKQIVSAIGDSLNLSFSGQSNPREQLLAHLQNQHTLLLLDNFDHLLEGAELISEFLTQAPQVRLLVTSRERLNLRAEWLFDVGGLSYPLSDQSNPDARKALAEYSAVQLFIQRATQVQPGFPLSDPTLAMIVRICQHVAGMPLAIELAAANLRVLSLAEIEQQIRSNLDTLTTTLRDVPVRHRSLRAVFDHSWNLLGATEQALFRRLSVFRGGCTAAAAMQVAGATLPALMMLVDKSLLQPETVKPERHTEPRFVLLGPLRDYAQEKLEAHDHVDVLQRSHAGFYLALAETVDAHWQSPTPDAFIEQLDCEHDNMRAAMQWALDGDRTLGLQLAGSLWMFWRRRGYISEGRAWLEELLALADDSSDATAVAVRLRALKGAAWLASYQHDFTHAARLFEQSMVLSRALGRTEGEASLLDNTARAWRSAGEYPRATALMEEALAHHRALNDQGCMSVGGLGYSLYELGLVLREQGDFARAAALFEECVEFHRARGDREGMGIGLLGLGDIARDQGDIAQIRKYSAESLVSLQELNVRWAIGFALNNLALGEYLEGNLTRALAIAKESVSLYRSQNIEASLAEVLVTQGNILRAQGDLTAAEDSLTEALRLALVVGPRLIVATALEALASVTIDQGNAVAAARLLSAASKLRAQMGAPIRPVDQPAFERALSMARSSLEPETFSAVWSEAETVTLDQIVNSLGPSSGRVRIPSNS